MSGLHAESRKVDYFMIPFGGTIGKKAKDLAPSHSQKVKGLILISIITAVATILQGRRGIFCGKKKNVFFLLSKAKVRHKAPQTGDAQTALI